MLLVGVLYNMVDQIFIANAACFGSCGNAANTVVIPLTVTSLAVMVDDGGLNKNKRNVRIPKSVLTGRLKSSRMKSRATEPVTKEENHSV